MLSKTPRLAWLAVPLALLLYLYKLDGTGLLGPDEPRYASISREMAQSGDWITPRLWGEPWFEKPALLYWISGAAFRIGLGPDAAPRVPVALIALAFLGLYWWILNREFGCRAAWFASLILGTSAGWVFYSQVGVPDIPLSAAFAAAMLLALSWIGRGDKRFLPAAGALLGLAVLAKGLVPLALAAPLALGGRRLRDWLAPRVAGPFLLVAGPWYLFCYLRNGRVFLEEFIIKQHFERFTSDTLKHVQPAWFYIPVLAGLLLPWTPLAPLMARRANLNDPRRRFLLVWIFFGLLLFSTSVNKLPGYVLPLAPAVAALLGVGIDETRNARPWLGACALTLVAFPIVVPIAPAAIAGGISAVVLPPFHWTWLAPVVLLVGAWLLETRGRRVAALSVIAIGAASGVLFLKARMAPAIDRAASARTLWTEIRGRSGAVCVENIGRAWRFGLNYYSVTPLPECSAEARPIRIVQSSDEPPRAITATALNRLTDERAPLYSHVSGH